MLLDCQDFSEPYNDFLSLIKVKKRTNLTLLLQNGILIH